MFFPVRRAVLRGTSLVLFGLVSVFLIAFGVLYASVHDMLWFHAAAVPEAAREEVRPLYFALMKLIGAASASLGLLGAWVVWGPMRNGARWAAMTLAAVFSAPLIMAAYVAETLAALTGAPTSWHLMGVVLAVIGLALFTHLVAARTPMQSPVGAA
jgi:hypothetical protein